MAALSRPSVAALAHLYTALGSVAGLAAALAAIGGRFREAFLWLAVATLIDATDGWLARRLRVRERLPGVDGARLDDVVDYVTYVFVPVLVMLEAGLLPAAGGAWVGAAVLVASAWGFAQADAKVSRSDYFFTGFPSYWNIVALYLFVWRLPPAVNAALVVALAALVFVPIRYVYPSRTRTLRTPTLLLGAAWGALLLVMIWRLPDTTGPWPALSLAFPAYYLALSLWLHARDTGTA
ncbi:MAG: phosphatidylcholine/phosphatidylserine synthase [Vicinamibacterales bacterium]